MPLPTLKQLDGAAARVYEYMPPTPQINWPLLSQRCGAEVWVKHENHNPTGAFKVRGGLVYLQNLIKREPGLAGLVTATRGNHGQSIALAARLHGISPTIVVPEGNSPDKNSAMQALGADLIVQGRDFDEATLYAQQWAQKNGLHQMPTFHMDLVQGVASYGLELLRSQPELQRIYVPIGLGSGICGMICARNALELSTEIIGVVSANADCYAQSLAARTVVTTATADTIADGVAVRTPSPDALAIMLGNVSRIVRVSDQAILLAVGYYFSDTHNVAEGAAAAPLAALLQEAELNRNSRVGLILSGGNIDSKLFRKALV